jgi:hypothetical protein
MTRFTLRDVFWLTLVVGMGVAWWMDRSVLPTRPKEYRAFRMDEVLEREGWYIKQDATHWQNITFEHLDGRIYEWKDFWEVRAPN